MLHAVLAERHGVPPDARVLLLHVLHLRHGRPGADDGVGPVGVGVVLQLPAAPRPEGDVPLQLRRLEPLVQAQLGPVHLAPSDDVRQGAAKALGGDAAVGAVRGDADWAVAQGLGAEAERLAVPVHVRVDDVQVVRGRQRVPPLRQQGLDEPADAGGRPRVRQAGLQRAQQQLLGLQVPVAPAEALGQGGHFYGVGQEPARPVALHGVNV
mmetsp:Transcript_82957/g.268393  ORF Transcript_82957/g.268393 Transcript_82957/m.268393 type:complete len:210 (+) Transcript_82957:299-928(+)